MSDSFDVSARVWPVVSSSGDCRVIATDGLVIVHHGPRRSSVLSSKLEVAYFMRQVLEAPSEEGADNDLIGAVANACRFAFDDHEQPPVGAALPSRSHMHKAEQELAEWAEYVLEDRPGSMVKTRDLRKAWNKHFYSSRGRTANWTSHQFDDHLRSFGYKVGRVFDHEIDGNYILNVAVSRPLN
jgi:hypothetical protein